MKRSEALARRARSESEREMKIGKEKQGGNFGIFILLAGLIWLAIEQGWIPPGWPIWPVVVIVVGLWLMMLPRKKH